MQENDVSHSVIGAAIEVHKHVGAGLLETVYQQCLLKEFDIRGIRYIAQAPVVARYKGLKFDSAYRMDILVENLIVIELKATDKILPVHEAQLLSYLRLTSKHLGLLINFNVPVLKSGVKRIVNNL